MNSGGQRTGYAIAAWLRDEICYGELAALGELWPGLDLLSGLLGELSLSQVAPARERLLWPTRAGVGVSVD